MAEETRASTRLQQTQPAVKVKSTGVIKTIVKMATANFNTHTFSSFKIDFVSIYNAGTEFVAIAWDTDDKEAATNPKYRTLRPGEFTPTFGITKDTQMHYKRLTGTGGHRLEITAWG